MFAHFLTKKNLFLMKNFVLSKRTKAWRTNIKEKKNEFKGWMVFVTFIGTSWLNCIFRISILSSYIAWYQSEVNVWIENFIRQLSSIIRYLSVISLECRRISRIYVAATVKSPDEQLHCTNTINKNNSIIIVKWRLC